MAHVIYVTAQSQIFLMAKKGLAFLVFLVYYFTSHLTNTPYLPFLKT